MPPEIVGRYKIVRKLGDGGMGSVYLAHDPRFPRHVALKLLHTGFAGKPTVRERFEREAQTIASLEHHAIVPVYDFGEQEGQLYLVMRLMGGGTLRDKLQGGPLHLSQVQSILERMASALDKAHEKGIIHRDLKPANILFDDEGKAYLSDFGIVKLADGQALTATHGIIGTPHYMSPEQAVGKDELDGRSDVYALGAVIYEMLCGEPPYRAETAMGVAMKHVTEPVPSLRTARPDLPVQLNAVVARAMAKAREERFSTAGEFAQAFAAAKESVSGEADTATVVEEWRGLPEQEPPPGSSDSLLTPRRVAMVALPLLALLSAFFFFRGRDVPAGNEDSGAQATDRAISLASTTLTATPAASRTPTLTSTPSATPPDTPTSTRPATRTPAPTPVETTQSGPAPTFVGQDDLEMALVPAGEFIMGSTEAQVREAMGFCQESGAGDPCGFGEFSNEMPQRLVYLDAFYMDVTEITNAHYRACVSVGQCPAPSDSPYYGSSRYDDYPVVGVSWYDARTYCLAMGERLPSEAEWEKAARGEDGRLFPWGDVFDGNLANTEERGGDRLRPVGQYPSGASPYGILDLSGSVWEWVNDWFDPRYYENAPEDNPPGPVAGSAKVLRGGSYSNHVHYARATNRGFRPPDGGTVYRGFRCVISAGEVSR